MDQKMQKNKDINVKKFWRDYFLLIRLQNPLPPPQKKIALFRFPSSIS